MKKSITTLAIALFIAFSNLCYSQIKTPLSTFEIFQLGMTEQEFRDAIISKYRIVGESSYSNTLFHDKSVELAKHNLKLKYLMIETPAYTIGNTGLSCEYFSFLFLNDQMYEINFWTPDYKLSEKEINAMIRHLSSKYAHQFKASKHHKPDTENKIYRGHYTLHSESLINNNLSDYGNILKFYYRVKNKHKNKAANKVTIKNNELEYYWKAHVIMTEKFRAKELKAYNAFRGINLGGSLSDFLATHESEVYLVSDTVVAKAYKNNPDVDVYLMHQAYVDVNPEPLPDIPLNEIDYFFYDGLLSTIRLSLDRNADLDKLEEMLTQVYGPVDRTDSQGSSYREYSHFSSKLNMNTFKFTLTLYRGSEEFPPAIIFCNEHLFDKCRKESESIKNKEIKNAF